MTTRLWPLISSFRVHFLLFAYSRGLKDRCTTRDTSLPQAGSLHGSSTYVDFVLGNGQGILFANTYSQSRNEFLLLRRRHPHRRPKGALYLRAHRPWPRFPRREHERGHEAGVKSRIAAVVGRNACIEVCTQLNNYFSPRCSNPR
jgi:hypothetical protein